MPDTHSGNINNGVVFPGGASKQGPHRVGAFSICPQLEGFGYELNLRPAIQKEAPAVGTLVHVGLAYRYGFLLSQRPSWLVYPDARTAIWVCGQDRPDFAQEALRIYDAYCAHWDPLIANGIAPAFRPLLVEHQFEVPFPMPDGTTEPYTARIDLLAEVMLSTGREMWLIDHKCLPGDATVHTAVGPERVDAIKQSWVTAAWDQPKAKLLYAPAGSPTPAGTQDVFQIRTRDGRVGRYGGNHPILTERGFVQTRDLVPGDRVAVAMNLPDIPEAPLADALIAATGLVIGDGGLTSAFGFTYTKTNRLLRGYFRSCLREMGDRCGVHGYRNHRTRKGKAPYLWVSPHAKTTARLHAVGLEFVGSAKKRVPRALMQLSRRQVGLLVGAFWSSDGAMYTVNEKGRKKVRIVYGSRSYGLCCDVRDLLVRLGLVTTVTSSSVKYRGKRRPYHFTTVVGRESKFAFLEMVIAGTVKRPGGAPIAARLHRTLQEKVIAGKNPKVDGDVYWDQVTTALFAGREPVYDITVPGYSTFVANGLITHNTGSKLTNHTGTSYRADRQMLTGLALCRAHGFNVNRVIINAMSREYPTPRFARFEVPISHEAYSRLGVDTAYVLEQMNDVRKRFPDPANRPRSWDSCLRKYGRCDFIDVCTNGQHELIQYVKRS